MSESRQNLYISNALGDLRNNNIRALIELYDSQDGYRSFGILSITSLSN
jgi:hypothetical protein